MYLMTSEPDSCSSSFISSSHPNFHMNSPYIMYFSILKAGPILNSLHLVPLYWKTSPCCWISPALIIGTVEICNKRESVSCFFLIYAFKFNVYQLPVTDFRFLFRLISADIPTKDISNPQLSFLVHWNIFDYYLSWPF